MSDDHEEAAIIKCAYLSGVEKHKKKRSEEEKWIQTTGTNVMLANVTEMEKSEWLTS